MANNPKKKDNQFDAFETQDSDEDYLPLPLDSLTNKEE